jgi:hypothetical protein
VEELLQRAGVDPLHLVVEGIVVVADFEDQLFAANVLVNAEVVGARELGSGRSDVILGDVGGVAIIEQLRVESVELECECRLLHTRRDIGAHQRSAEPL